ncbi:uncharacterized protein LOC107018833 [Solanum pennellii]|uniref:Uncharacterized protein LOC107018833 n=1 Tax=Solanum pennellii TaxID=28526 RepID=A0ABM1VAE5_SOLPN|nr:uncharacterized protein LOC107018833 [Solanum pennellii]
MVSPKSCLKLLVSSLLTIRPKLVRTFHRKLRAFASQRCLFWMKILNYNTALTKEKSLQEKLKIEETEKYMSMLQMVQTITTQKKIPMRERALPLATQLLWMLKGCLYDQGACYVFLKLKQKESLRSKDVLCQVIF